MRAVKKLLTGIFSLSLMVVVITPLSAQGDLAVPKSAWPACDDFRVDFCIESISIRPIGTKVDLDLVWYERGYGPIYFDEPERVEHITGPTVIVPGTSATYTTTFSEENLGFSYGFKYTGVGQLISTVGPKATATITADIDDNGQGGLELYADFNSDGEFTFDEILADKYIAVGYISEVGTGITETRAGANTAGQWSHPKWRTYGLQAYGYDGLTVDLKAANAFTNHLFFTVYPTKADKQNFTTIATRTDGSGLAANLNMNDRITITVRTGEILTGISIAVANNLSFASQKPTQNESGEIESGSLVISGSPVPVPQIRSITQCVGETSKASAVVNTMQGFLIVENDNMGFGIDGLSGRMSVASNGASCGLSSPVWDSASETLSWQAGAPHFEPDGVTTTKGFYKAIIPAADALLLWGLADPKRAVTDLYIQVTEEAGGPAVAASKISYLHGNIIVDVTGFTFSKPTVKITKKKGASGFVSKRDLKCVDPVTGDSVTLKAVYGCPSSSAPVFKQASLKRHTTSTLNSSQKAQIRTLLSNYIEANKFICTGIYLEGATLKQKSDARRNAKQACDYAESKDGTLSYWYQTKATKAPSYKNSVLISMKSQY